MRRCNCECCFHCATDKSYKLSYSLLFDKHFLNCTGEERSTDDVSYMPANHDAFFDGSSSSSTQRARTWERASSR